MQGAPHKQCKLKNGTIIVLFCKKQDIGHPKKDYIEWKQVGVKLCGSVKNNEMWGLEAKEAKIQTVVGVCFGKGLACQTQESGIILQNIWGCGTDNSS